MSRFAFLITDLFGGGAQRSLIDIASGLQARGHEVVVFTLRDLIEIDVPQDLSIVNLNLVNRFTKTISMRAVERWQAKKIEKVLDGFLPNVVLSCSCDKITRHIARHKVFMWVKIDIGMSGASAHIAQKWKKRYQSIYGTHRCIAPTNGVKESIVESAQADPKRIEVIPNAFDRERLQVLSRKPCKQLEPLLGQPFLLSLGTLERRKRHDWLFESYRSSGIDWPLVVVGKGSPAELSRIQELIAEHGLSRHVWLIGYLENPYPFIAQAAATIMTSEREGLPRALIESLMLHTPVLSFDCPSGPREILTGDLSQWLVPLGDCEGMARALRSLSGHLPVIEESHYKQFLFKNVLEKFEILAAGG